jgi:hypothetical protein
MHNNVGMQVLAAERNGEMGCKKASMLFGVPGITLKGRVTSVNKYRRC